MLKYTYIIVTVLKGEYLYLNRIAALIYRMGQWERCSKFLDVDNLSKDLPMCLYVDSMERKKLS